MKVTGFISALALASTAVATCPAGSTSYCSVTDPLCSGGLLKIVVTKLLGGVCPVGTYKVCCGLNTSIGTCTLGNVIGTGLCVIDKL
ncbi:hypothetical protein GQ602_005087 [Ophiocordyceps camponoti-floridani]|uniref:Hydrophobin n=1 Tax=Ophiocordyceps camponoti-floridani TaxID=2030778 RepID=A0A8H4VCU8_9HYPO|nr:hypothetical protein GQ602_005087 [Ophiocordyceps camponoti-floridani]